MSPRSQLGSVWIVAAFAVGCSLPQSQSTNVPPAEVSLTTLTGLSISPGILQLPKGLSAEVHITGAYSDDSKQDVSDLAVLTASDPSLVDIVHQAGSFRVTSRGMGTVQLSATFEERSDSVRLAITDARLDSLNLTASADSIPAGISSQVQLMGRFSDGSFMDLTEFARYQSEDEGIATVSNVPSSKGMVIGLSAGSVAISAAYGGMSASVHFAVTAAVLQSLEIIGSGAAVPSGLQSQLTALGHFSDGSTMNVSADATWSSSDPTIALIDANGLVSALFPGISNVGVSVNDIRAAAPFLVTAAIPVGLIVNGVAFSLPKGLTLQLSAFASYSDGSFVDVTQQALWSANLDAIASVTNASGSSGIVSGLAQGSADIHARFSTLDAMQAVTVTDPVLQGVEFSSPGNIAVAKGLSFQFSAVGHYSDSSVQDLTSMATWSSDDATVMSISKGLGDAIFEGDTVVRISYDGFNASASVKVSPAALTSVSMSSSSMTLAAGEVGSLIFTGTYSDGTVQDLTLSATWTSDNEPVATVSGGDVSGVSAGSALVTGSYNGMTDSSAITVR